MPDLLYEIGTEELPAGYLEPALEQLAAELRARLEALRIPPASVRTAGTPRRLTVAASGIPERQPAQTVRIVGPPARAAYDQAGNPTKAAEGFARSRGLSVQDLRVEQTEKGPYVVAVLQEPGLPAAELLPGVLREATAVLSFPKSMRWEPSGFTFARPIRWLVALLDDQVLPVALAGVTAGRTTLGHPFLARRGLDLKDASFKRYVQALRRRHVLADPQERREACRREVNALLTPHGSQLDDERLLGEVANLVEWPHAVEGSFDEQFLGVPDSVVTAAMKSHQRYFPVRDAGGRLLPRFITISNRTAAQDDTVREGNERVLRARFEDAQFYWEQDRERRLDDLVPRLEGVTFLAGLGNNLQRTERLGELAGGIAERIDGANVAHVRRAARLCKADLVTGLVGEFPELQGVVGRELALVQGEPLPVADAIAEHYLPAGADSALPASAEGAALALADKLDVIVGCFSLGLLPKGSQDPYALRRNALGVLLILERRALPLALGELLAMARRAAAGHGIRCDDAAAGQILEFFRDRLYNAALDRGHAHDFVRAVLAAGSEDVADFWRRLDALAECSKRPWWPALVELVDRTYRIQKDLAEAAPVRDDLLTEPRERALAAALAAQGHHIAALFDARDYVQAAGAYCEALARPVHDFFDDVFVNVEDQAVRSNRKSLCAGIYRLFAERFADLYLIQTSGEQEHE